MKLFSKEKDRFHDIYRIFGIKLKILNKNYLKDEIAKLDKTINNDVLKKFYYSYSNKLTTEEKIRNISQQLYSGAKYYPDFKRPKTYNEKLNWIRFNYYNPIRKYIHDKCTFKTYIKEKIGEGYTIPLIKIYDDINDINFDELPEKFVIKTTKGGGGKGVKIVKDKNSVDMNELKYDLSFQLNRWNGIIFSEPYTKETVPEKIIVEEYMEQLAGQLYDYKFHCFNGEPKLIYVATDHFPGVVSKIAFYDMNWKKLPIKYGAHSNKQTVKKPKFFDEMVRISKILSKDFPFVRVDFYETNDKIYVGELTFLPSGATAKFSPLEWDYKIGEWLDLSKIPEENLRILPEFVKGAKTFIDSETVDRCTVKTNDIPIVDYICK